MTRMCSQETAGGAALEPLVEELEDIAERLGTALPQMEMRRRWERDGEARVRQLRLLYERRLALVGEIAESMERCRSSVQAMRALQSRLHRLDGDLLEIDALLRGEE